MGEREGNQVLLKPHLGEDAAPRRAPVSSTALLWFQPQHCNNNTAASPSLSAVVKIITFRIHILIRVRRI